MFLVEGPAGIGKSRLAEQFASAMESDGWRSLTVAGAEFDRSVPGSLITDVLHGLGGADPDPGDRDPRTLARMIRRLLDTAPTQLRSVPTLLVIDDVHWADTMSLRVLALLIRNRPSARILLAYREGQFPDVLGPALHGSGVSYRHVVVPPLSATEAVSLLPDLPAGRRDRLIDAAHGNPLYLQLLADLAPADFEAVLLDGDPAAAPADHTALDRTIRAELAHLPERERIVAQAAAVCGTDADVELLCATAEVTRADLDAAIDDLSRRGWLTVTSGAVDFRHPLIRAAAYRLSGQAWRAAAHARAAERLRQTGAPVLTRARHLEHAFGRDESAAIDLLDAAEHALATDPGASVRWITAGLLSAPDTASHKLIPTRLLLGRALLLCGSIEHARETLEALLPDGSSVPVRQQVEAALLYARCERILGRVDSARNLLSQTIDQLPDDEFGPVVLELAILELQDNRDTEGGRRVRQLFESPAIRDPALRAAATTLLSMGLLNAMEIQDAIANYRAAEQEFTRLTDTELLDGIHAIAALGWMAYFLDDQRTGLTHIERAIRVARTRGRSFILPELHTVHAYSLAKLGRYEEALAAAEDAAETAETYAYPGILPLAGALKLRVLEETSPRAEVMAWWQTINALPLPAVQWWRAVVEAALQEISARLSDGEVPLRQPTPRPHPMQAAELSVTALIAVDQGDLNTAANLVTLAENAAERLTFPSQLAAAARARAGYLRARGDLTTADQAANSAADAYAQADMPVFRAQSILLAAQIAADRGDFTLATARIATARAAFTTAGATELLRSTLTTQRRLAGHQPPTAPTTLTNREHQIAELAAKGLSNKDIATHLYLSPRTVEDHLSRILRKLGLTSRAGIAHRLTALDKAQLSPTEG